MSYTHTCRCLLFVDRRKAQKRWTFFFICWLALSPQACLKFAARKALFCFVLWTFFWLSLYSRIQVFFFFSCEWIDIAAMVFCIVCVGRLILLSVSSPSTFFSAFFPFMHNPLRQTNIIWQCGAKCGAEWIAFVRQSLMQNNGSQYFELSIKLLRAFLPQDLPQSPLSSPQLSLATCIQHTHLACPRAAHSMAFNSSFQEVQVL